MRMPGWGRHAVALFTLAGLAAVSTIAAIWTGVNYLQVSRAAAGFRVSVTAIREIYLEEAAGGQAPRRAVVRLSLSFANRSELPLSVVSLEANVYRGDRYLWGKSFDWTAQPFRLPPGKERELELDITLPARGPGDETGDHAVHDTLSAYLGGLVEIPMVGRKPFRVHP